MHLYVCRGQRPTSYDVSWECFFFLETGSVTETWAPHLGGVSQQTPGACPSTRVTSRYHCAQLLCVLNQTGPMLM